MFNEREREKQWVSCLDNFGMCVVGDEKLTAVMPPTMAMMTEVIAEMTASMARPIAEIIPPCSGSSKCR